MRFNPTASKGRAGRVATVSTFILFLFGASACTSEPRVTLYRNSLVQEDARIHVATFDSSDRTPNGTSLDYNVDNCELAAELFKSQLGVNPKMRYWCEHGAFKP